MAVKKEPNSTARDRIGIIQAVKTPLNFFVLVALIVDSILGVIVFKLPEGSNRTFVIKSLVYLIFTLVMIVAIIAIITIYKQKNSLNKIKRFRLLIGPPKDLPYLDMTSINWDKNQCFLKCGDLTERIHVVLSLAGSSFEVKIPSKVFEKINEEEEPIEIELKDMKGNSWKINDFFLNQTILPLVPGIGVSKTKIIDDYGDADQ